MQEPFDERYYAFIVPVAWNFLNRNHLLIEILKFNLFWIEGVIIGQQLEEDHAQTEDVSLEIVWLFK